MNGCFQSSFTVEVGAFASSCFLLLNLLWQLYTSKGVSLPTRMMFVWGLKKLTSQPNAGSAHYIGSPPHVQCRELGMLTSMRKHTFWIHSKESNDATTMYKKWPFSSWQRHSAAGLKHKYMYLYMNTYLYIYMYCLVRSSRLLRLPNITLVQKASNMFVGGHVVLECTFQLVCVLITFVWNGKSVYEYLTEKAVKTS